jgi:hypothetical protein
VRGLARGRGSGPGGSPGGKSTEPHERPIGEDAVEEGDDATRHCRCLSVPVARLLVVGVDLVQGARVALWGRIVSREGKQMRFQICVQERMLRSLHGRWPYRRSHCRHDLHWLLQIRPRGTLCASARRHPLGCRLGDDDRRLARVGRGERVRWGSPLAGRQQARAVSRIEACPRRT